MAKVENLDLVSEIRKGTREPETLFWHPVK
jgi:hypothetical protein